MTFYDTGRKVSREDLAKAQALQYAAFYATGEIAQDAREKALEHVKTIAKKVNVFPMGKAALTDDGRILVTEPWYEAN